MQTQVSAIKCGSYDQAEIMQVLSAHFDNLGGIEKFIKRGTKVLLKANLLMARRPDEVTTTHPSLIEAMSVLISKAGGTVMIADSPGGIFTPGAMHSIYKTTGMEQAAKNSGASLCYDCGSRSVNFAQAKRCKQFEIIDAYFNADIVINMCKMKSHMFTGFTGAVKNMFGLVPGLLKSEFHLRFPEKRDFCEMLVDLCLFARPALSFMDGIIGMDGNGPSGGSPFVGNITFASENPFALDMIAMHATGYSPTEVYTLADSIERGLCPSSVDDIELLGASLSDIKLQGFRKPDSQGGISKLIRFGSFAAPRPVIGKRGCIGCGKCAESCPATAIKIIENKAVIDYKECIKCFCCQEMCPVKTIAVRRLSLFNH